MILLKQCKAVFINSVKSDKQFIARCYLHIWWYFYSWSLLHLLSAVQTSGCWKRKALQTSATPPAHNSGATSHTTSPPHSGLTTPPKNSGLLEQRRKLMSFENPWEIEIICEIDVKWKGGRGKRKLFPGWSFLMRGAKRGLEAGLTGNRAWHTLTARDRNPSAGCSWGAGRTTSWRCRANRKVRPIQVTFQFK